MLRGRGAVASVFISCISIRSRPHTGSRKLTWNGAQTRSVQNVAIYPPGRSTVFSMIRWPAPPLISTRKAIVLGSAPLGAWARTSWTASPSVRKSERVMAVVYAISTVSAVSRPTFGYGSCTFRVVNSAGRRAGRARNDSHNHENTRKK